SMRNSALQNFQLLRNRLKGHPDEIQVLARKVLELEPQILAIFRTVYAQSADAVRIRCHGSYHLGQLLHTGKEFLIIDFEGDPAVALSERRLKQSPLRDVAGMIRSFHYAAEAELMHELKQGTLSPSQKESLTSWARFWSRWIGAVFYEAYTKAV